MMLPGVPREERIRFTARMTRLLLDLGFQDEFPEEVMEIVELIEDLAEMALESDKVPDMTPGGC
jgi:hypothetical protein